ncbi:amidohydrolase/deacetylase family metallohydrolase [Kaistia dalseonensis]|uniref:Dihydroorotase n=1 Tax=Kaistia dalseonensis TaxID=410840 RepID=A0ABU0H8U0_9HYPH|nr:amidohydrolase/deacetylase family metallohydrolase [Kaistia dalseonensis]MCX5495568.1 amidohydrolase/deacetylase family metallohydrolase [Kaistia dalseonensis]MDQ0438160.1 dihydroorotase [Kaistia dalseonensis]
MGSSASHDAFDLILSGGRVLDERNGIDGILDIGVRDGRVAAIASELPKTGAATVRDVTGAIVAPGLIDIHTHIYHKATSLSVAPDPIARRSAITTLVDAGSAGAGNFEGLRDYIIGPSPYRILAYLNISFPGIFAFDKNLFVGEAAERALLIVDRCVEVCKAHPEIIVGVKVRIGGPASGDLGLEALDIALEAAEKAGLPLMTHIGGPPPSYAEVVERLRPGDILTHCYRPDPNSAFTENGAVLPAVQAAQARGVLFDIGHGMGAFGYESVDRALAAGFLPDMISSDVHQLSVNGPAFDLLHTMSKLINSGVPLESAIGMASSRPALAMRRPELGHLGIGAPADISILKLVEARYPFTDVSGAIREGQTLLQPVATYLGGQEMETTRRPFEERFICNCC